MVAVDVVVVGAGAMGSAAAWWLARRGRSVALLERFERGHSRGSSHGSTRLFRLGYTDPLYVRLAREALPLWRELEDDAGVRLLETSGALDHGEPAAVEAVADALGASGAPFERLHPAAAAERYPGIRFDRTVVLQPDGGRISAEATVAALQDRAAAHGADLVFEVGAATVVPVGDGVEVRGGHDGAHGGTAWRAPAVIVTVGSWAEPVLGPALKTLGPNLPDLVVTREQWQHLRPRDARGEWPGFIHRISPEVYGLLGPEGVKVATHHDGEPTTGDGRSFEPAPFVLDWARRYAEHWLPGCDPEPVHPSTCLYTSTPSRDFVVDRIGPVVVGSPCSGHGFKFTPLVGRVLADLADGTLAATPHGRWALVA